MESAERPAVLIFGYATVRPELACHIEVVELTPWQEADRRFQDFWDAVLWPAMVVSFWATFIQALAWAS